MFPCKNVLDWWNLIYGFNFIYLLDFLAFLLYKKLNVLKSRLVLLAHLRFPQFLTLISFCKRALFALNILLVLILDFSLDAKILPYITLFTAMMLSVVCPLTVFARQHYMLVQYFIWHCHMNTWTPTYFWYFCDNVQC